MSALVEIKDVCKVYNPGENEVRALDHVSLTIDEQEFVNLYFLIPRKSKC